MGEKEETEGQEEKKFIEIPYEYRLKVKLLFDEMSNALKLSEIRLTSEEIISLLNTNEKKERGMNEEIKFRTQSEISKSIDEILDELKQFWIDQGHTEEELELMLKSFMGGFERGEKFADEIEGKVRQIIVSFSDVLNKSKLIASCGFPPCPKCESGFLVPFSSKPEFQSSGRVFDIWKCTCCNHKIFSPY